LRTSAFNHVQLNSIVVSNNPNARTLLKNTHVDAVYRADVSFGFAQLNNTAIGKSIKIYDSDYYLCINDDAWVAENFFAVFNKIAQSHKPDLLSPRIYTPDGSIDSFGIEYFTSGYAENSHSRSFKTTCAPASCLVVKTEFLKKMKQTYSYYFNPLLHAYYEDVEFSIRANAIGGSIMKKWRLIAYHRGSSSYGKNSKEVMFYTFRNILWTIGMTWPKQYLLIYLPQILMTQAWFIFCSIRDGGWWIYPKILIETLKQKSSLYQYRCRITHAYTQPFSNVFSQYWFRTRRNARPFIFPFTTQNR